MINRFSFRFPIPDIPKGWKPDPKRVWERNKNKENENIASLKLPVQGPVPHRKWKKGISADEASISLIFFFWGGALSLELRCSSEDRY